jgi:hypothetical protein
MAQFCRNSGICTTGQALLLPRAEEAGPVFTQRGAAGRGDAGVPAQVTYSQRPDHPKSAWHSTVPSDRQLREGQPQRRTRTGTRAVD